MNNKIFIIIIILMVLVSVISFASYLPQRSDTALNVKMEDFPKTIGEWTSTDIPLSERDYKILETKNLIMREYKNSRGDSVHLYLIYSEQNRKVSHPPEVCYMGAGATITEKSQARISNAISANTFIIEEADNRNMVAYWYKAGNFYTNSYLKQQSRIVLDRVFGKRTSGALIRVSSDIKDEQDRGALTLLQEFSSEIEPLLAKYAP